MVFLAERFSAFYVILSPWLPDYYVNQNDEWTQSPPCTWSQSQKH